MKLTPYQIDKMKRLEQIDDGKWYAIKADRPDREEFIEFLKVQIDVWNNIEINKDWTAFRRMYPHGTCKWIQDNRQLLLFHKINEKKYKK